MKLIIFFLAIKFIQFSHAEVPLNRFSTDYCTGYRDGTRERPGVWKHCCLEHDLYFWAGGSLDDRRSSDLRLGRCVEATGEIEHARLIYAAVAIGAFSPITLKNKQFGNGWSKSRPRYKSLTEDEVRVIFEELDTNTQWLPKALRNSFKQQINSRLGKQ